MPVILLFFVLWHAIRIKGQALVVLGAIVLSVAASLYYSISEGYQAQGRYLFPVLAVTFLLARDSLQAHIGILSVGALSTLLALSLFRPLFF